MNDLTFTYENSDHDTATGGDQQQQERTDDGDRQQPQQKAANSGGAIIAPPPSVKELRASPERQMFGDSSAKEIGDVLRSETNLDTDMMFTDVSPEARRAFFTEVGHIAQDLELSTTDVREMITLSREDHPGIQARFTETVKALTERYGVNGRQAAYDAAYALIDRDPRARSILASALILDHPRVVLKLAEKALSMKARGAKFK